MCDRKYLHRRGAKWLIRLEQYVKRVRLRDAFAARGGLIHWPKSLGAAHIQRRLSAKERSVGEICCVGILGEVILRKVFPEIFGDLHIGGPSWPLRGFRTIG